MGKKRVVNKIQSVPRSSKMRYQASRKIKSKKLSQGRVYIQSTYNNTIVTLTDMSGNVVVTLSAGMLGFKGPRRSTPFAASQVARTLAEKVDQTGLKDIEVYVKGIGAGREAAIRALAGAGLNITFIKDVTPVPHNGPRPKKPRKV